MVMLTYKDYVRAPFVRLIWNKYLKAANAKGFKTVQKYFAHLYAKDND